jgi:hypothetical protein
MMILGAGASYDSVDLDLDPNMQSALPFRPPLAKDLFDARPNFSRAFDMFADLRPLVNRLRRAVGRGDQLESALKEIEDEAIHFPIRNRQLLAVRCYLQQIIGDCARSWTDAAHGVTHYAELVDEVERWQSRTNEPVFYVTFNYDTMLEAVLGQAYRTIFNDLTAYMTPEFQVFKLHGSVDWGHLVALPPQVAGNEAAARNYLFDHAGQYHLSDIVRAQQSLGISGDDGLVPALAIPVQGKSTFECPTSHLDMLNRAIWQTTRVITIGWRGVEQHFLELWRNRNDFFNLLVVSGSKEWSEETLINLQSGGMLDPDTPRYARIAFDGGFGAVLGSGELRSFLQA